MGVYAYVYRLVLGVWVGALLCFGAVVAPVLFKVLPSEQAGVVVRGVLPILETYGIVASLLLLFLTSRSGTRRGWVRSGFLAVMGAFAALSMVVVFPAMAQLREHAQGGLSHLPDLDPLRRQYGRWHAVSSALAAGELVLGLLALWLDPVER